MKKLLSGALAALLLAAQGGLLQAAEFEARADQTGAALPMAAALNPAAADFNLLPAAQNLGAAGADAPAAAPPEFFKAALAPQAAVEAEAKAAAPAAPAQAPEAAPRAATPAAVRAKPSARARLVQAAAFFKGTPKKDIMGAAERQDAFWAGAALAPQDAVPEAGSARTPAQFEKNLSRLKAPSESRPGAALAAAAVPAAISVIPAEIASLAVRFAPYLKIGGIFLGAHLANKLVRRAIDKAGARRSWPQDKISLYKSVSTIAVWGLGGLVALPVMGVALNHIAAAAGVTGVLVSIAAGDVINNVFEAARVLLARPFVPGGRVSVGGKDYTVESMGWHDLLLLDANGGRTVMPYTTLSGSVLAVAPESAPP
ncbi:MAG: mechanosensitive ion channel, partial [Elusimicrobia bacterium]|nr:mechanosensitive ion channel [Elusimicrobiota bacterium]